VLLQSAEIENLKQEKEKLKLAKEKLRQENLRLAEEKDSLRIRNEKLAEESAYAKELASQAAVELKNLAEEVTKLSFQNSNLQNDLIQSQEVTFQNAKLQAELVKLQSELKKSQETAFALASMKSPSNPGRSKAMTNGDTHIDSDNAMSGRGTLSRTNAAGNRGLSNIASRNGKPNSNGHHFDDADPEAAVGGLKREVEAAKEKEAFLVSAMAEKEASLQAKLEEAKQRETNLENDLASMWVLVAKLKKEREAGTNPSTRGDLQGTSQEFQTSGTINEGVLDTEKTKHADGKDIDALAEQLARTELYDSLGNNFWSSGVGTTELDQEELYSSYSNSAFPSLAESTSFGSTDQPVETVLDQSNPFAERQESGGPASKGAREGMRSLEELKFFMEEERKRGSELGTLVSQLKASSVPTASTNPFLPHHVAQQNGSPHAGGGIEVGLWTSFESSSYYKS
jgi:hypothetical protein